MIKKEKILSIKEGEIFMCDMCECCKCDCPNCKELSEEEEEMYDSLSEREQLKFNLKGFPVKVIEEMLKSYDDAIKEVEK